MKLSNRPCQNKADCWRIHRFLRHVFIDNGRRELSWHAYRVDYCRWHAYENIARFDMRDVVTLWETSEGQLASVLHPESPGEIFIQMDPSFQSAALEEEMIACTEPTAAILPVEGIYAAGSAVYRGIWCVYTGGGSA